MSDRTARYLRPLGAFERTIDLYMHRNPVQFSLTAELAREVTKQELTRALRVLQRVHPLLAAGVDRAGHSGHDPRTAVFRHSAGDIPVRVTGETSWEREAALEQTATIEPAPGPLTRVVLIPSPGEGVGATIVVTFAHQITDGRGALRAVQDLVTILAGGTVAPLGLPAAQENLLANLEPAATPDTDARPSAPGRRRPFDAAVPTVQADDLGAVGTRSLVERSRAESCTVQVALCAAAALALPAATQQDRVRINVPIDLRRAVGLDDDVVVRFGATTVVLDEPAGTSFWDLARTAAAQLEAARKPATVRASAMLAATNADVEITNLGVSDGPAADQDVLKLWGPTMTTQVADEQILGVVTHRGVLRMVNVAHDPVTGLVEKISQELRIACG